MVFVDNSNDPYGDMIMCHMIADSNEELLAMADKIGIKREWIKHPGTKKEHFDICLSKKKLAIKAGAVEVSTLETVHLLEIADEDPAKDPKDMNLAELVQYFEAHPDHKTETEIIVVVRGIKYLIPHYCLTDHLWDMPDDWFPVNKYQWADNPLLHTSTDMLKYAIERRCEKFKAFILDKR